MTQKTKPEKLIDISSEYMHEIIKNGILQENYKRYFYISFKKEYKESLSKISRAYIENKNDIEKYIDEFTENTLLILNESIENSLFDLIYRKFKEKNIDLKNEKLLPLIEDIICFSTNQDTPWHPNYKYEFCEQIKKLIFTFAINFAINRRFSKFNFVKLMLSIVKLINHIIDVDYFEDLEIKKLKIEELKIIFRKPSTISDVFIIESLHKKDIEDKHDGKKLYTALKLSGKNPKYFQVENQFELKNILEIFKNSRYRFLHISCHASKNTIELANGEVLFYKDFSNLFKDVFNQHRLFISACELGNEEVMTTLMRDHLGKLHSVIAPNTKFLFNHAYSFWITFYISIFEETQTVITSKLIKEIIQNLTKLLPLSIAMSTYDPQHKKTNYCHIQNGISISNSKP